MIAAADTATATGDRAAQPRGVEVPHEQERDGRAGRLPVLGEPARLALQVALEVQVERRPHAGALDEHEHAAGDQQDDDQHDVHRCGGLWWAGGKGQGG